MPPRARKAAAKTATASRRARATKAPTDRKAPARALAAEVAKSEYVFVHNGESYFLPNAAPYAIGLDGGLVMDMLLSESEADYAKIVFQMFADAEKDIEPEAWNAARSKPFAELSELLIGWLRAGGVDLGK